MRSSAPQTRRLLVGVDHVETSAASLPHDQARIIHEHVSMASPGAGTRDEVIAGRFELDVPAAFVPSASPKGSKRRVIWESKSLGTRVRFCPRMGGQTCHLLQCSGG